MQSGMEWVPRFGMLEVPRERAELIRGLFELAAFVADHPELPLPDVRARFFKTMPVAASAAERYVATRALVDEVGAALGVVARDDAGQHEVRAVMGAVEVLSIAYSPESWARWEATQSYCDNVVTEPVAGGTR
jgi:hypothetical protein